MLRSLLPLRSVAPAAALLCTLLTMIDATPLAAADPRSGELPTSCIIDGFVFDECPLDDSEPPWGGGGHGNLPLIKPDLGARGGGFSITPAVLAPGSPFQAHAVLENFGGLDFAGDNVVRVDFYLVKVGTVAFAAANQLGSVEIVFPLVTSASLGEVGVLVSLDGNLPEIADGEYKLGVDIDVGDLVAELSEANNRVVGGDAVSVGGGADLVPSLDGFSVNSPVAQGETLTITSTLRNAGTVAVDGPKKVVVRYRAVPEGGDELGGTVLGQVIVPIAKGASLAAGSARSVPPFSAEVALPPGTYSIAADVDFGGTNGTVAEFDESNNSRLLAAVVIRNGPLPAPDFRFSFADMDLEADPISAGNRLFLTLRLADPGPNRFPHFFPGIRIKASEDRTVEATDITIADFSHLRKLFRPLLPADGIVRLEVPWPAGLTGTFTVGAIVDPENEIHEPSEDNNVAELRAVDAVVTCFQLPKRGHAEVALADVFTSDQPLSISPLLHPALQGELCANSLGEDVDFFRDVEDSCHFEVRYAEVEAFVDAELLPAMQRACVKTFAALVDADPAAATAAYRAGRKLKLGLADAKASCDADPAAALRRRYCSCPNPDYLDWAPQPGPGNCVYNPLSLP